MNLRATAIRRGSVALGAVIAALVIVACGSSSSTSSSAAGGTSSKAASTGRGRFGNPAQRAKLVACLKQHGVTLPSRPPGGGPPTGSGSGSGAGAPPAGGFGSGSGRARGFFGGGAGGAGANPKFRAALQACGANFGRRRFNAAARKTQITKFVTCVNQHGYKLPAPNFSGKGSVFPAKIQSNAKFQKASRACASVLRPPGGAGGPGSAAGGGGAPPPSA